MLTRRSLFKTLLSAALVAPLARIAPLSAAMSKKIEEKLLDVNSKTAKRLDYVAKAADAKKTKSKGKYKAGANCANCKFYKADKDSPEWGKCSMAANKYVSGEGWCKSHRFKKKKKG